MSSSIVHHKLTAILAADVAGYSRLMGEDPEGTLANLNKYREVFFEKIAQYQGRVVSSPGDAVLAEFGSVREAVQCAVEVQEVMKERNTGAADNRRMDFRIGVNLGEVMVQEGDIFGDGVNVAARLESLAEPGGVWISGQAYREVKNHLPYGFVFMGDHKAKNIADPVSAYRVLPGNQNGSGGLLGGIRVGSIQGRKRLRLTIAAAVALLVLIAAGAYYSGTRNGDTQEEPGVVKSDLPSIAVLAFNNLSNDPEQEHFSDGISEDIITDLSKISGLFVVARNSSFAFKGQQVPVEQIAKKLRVQYILEGSVRKTGGRIRINAQLVDSTSGEHLWAERYDRDLVDVFKVQDEIAEKIVSNLNIHLKMDEIARIRFQSTANPEAWEEYRKGQALYRTLNGYSHFKAWEHFEKALKLDPEFEAAMVGLGYLFAYSSQFGNDLIEVDDPLDEAQTLAEQALRLNENFGDAHALLSRIHLARGQYDRAVATAQTAARLNPNSADAQENLAHVLSKAGRYDDAITPIKHALRLNPVPPEDYLFTMGEVFYHTGQPDKAIPVLEEVLGMSEFVPAKFLLIASYVDAGRGDEIKGKVKELLNFPFFATPAAAFDIHFRFNTPETRQKLREDLAKVGVQVL